jgi:hypothetical protein
MTALLAVSRQLVVEEVGIGLNAYGVSASMLAIALAITADLLARTIRSRRSPPVLPQGVQP